MNEQKYDNQILNEYLLGTLPEAETERFDELCFTDEDFADHLSSAENNLIDAYIQDELTGATLEKFKSHYLASPLRREKINFAESFQTFAKHSVNATDEPVLTVADSNLKQKNGGFFSSLNIFAAHNSARRWGFAVIGLILITTGIWWFMSRTLNRGESEIASRQESPVQNYPGVIQPASQNSDTAKDAANTNENDVQQTLKEEQSLKPPTPEKLPSKKEQPTTNPIVASFVLAPPLRDASRIQSFSIPKQAGQIAVRLPFESADYPAYRIALTNEDGSRNFWTSGKLHIKSHGENKALNIRFPAKLLTSQIYLLTVSGITSNGENEIISNYPFRAVLK